MKSAEIDGELFISEEKFVQGNLHLSENGQMKCFQVFPCGQSCHILAEVIKGH